MNGQFFSSSPLSQKGGKGGRSWQKERKYFGSVGLSQSAKIGQGGKPRKKLSAQILKEMCLQSRFVENELSTIFSM